MGPIAKQILAYLSRNPEAQDTLEGIAGWWLMEERIRESLVETQSALDDLAAARLVVVRKGADGKGYYQINPERVAEVQAFCGSQGKMGSEKR